MYLSLLQVTCIMFTLITETLHIYFKGTHHSFKAEMTMQFRVHAHDTYKPYNTGSTVITY